MNDLLGYKNKKLKIHHLYFFKHRQSLVSMVKKGLQYDGESEEGERKEYAEVIDALKLFLADRGRHFEAVVNNNGLTHNILSNYCQITEADKALLFVLTFEQISQSLHFEFNHKGLCLYLLISSIDELKKQAATVTV